MSILRARAEAQPRKYKDHFRIRYISPIDGKRKSLSVKTTGPLNSKEEAEEWMETHLETLLSYEVKLVERQRWRDATEWIKLVGQFRLAREKEIKSIRQEFSYIENWIMPYFLVEAKMHDANDWYKKVWDFQNWLQTDCFTKPSAENPKGQKISHSTANKIINATNHFMKWLEKHQYISRENVREIPCLKEGQSGLNKEEVELLFEDEFKAVVQAFKRLQEPSRHSEGVNVQHYTTYYDVYLTQYWTGCRSGEVLGLNLSHMRTKSHCPKEILESCSKEGLVVHGVLFLNSQPAHDYIKREDVHEVPIKPLKWRKSTGPRDTRIIPITDEGTWKILAGRAKKQAELLKNKKRFGLTPENYLIFSENEGVQLAQRAVYLEILKKVFKEAGLKFKHPHTLRHARSTDWVLKFPEKIYQTILGHKAQAAEAYHHIATKMIRDAESKDAVDDFLNM